MNYFKHANQDENFVLIYNQYENDSGWKIHERIGSNAIEHYNNGVVKYEQFEFFKTKKELDVRMVELLAITNRKYRDFKIMERTENLTL